MCCCSASEVAALETSKCTRWNDFSYFSQTISLTTHHRGCLAQSYFPRPESLIVNDTWLLKMVKVTKPMHFHDATCCKALLSMRICKHAEKSFHHVGESLPHVFSFGQSLCLFEHTKFHNFWDYISSSLETQAEIVHSCFKTVFFLKLSFFRSSAM